MAYNYFPAAYNPYFGGYQQMPTQQIQQQQQNVPPQIQNGGFVTVRSMQEAYNYPVAIGNSVTFKDETAPYIYVKTRGFSQLEEPIFEQFQLVKVDAQKSTETAHIATKSTDDKSIEYAQKGDITALWSEIEAIKKQIGTLTVPEGSTSE